MPIWCVLLNPCANLFLSSLSGVPLKQFVCVTRSAGVLKLCLKLTGEPCYRWRAKPAWSLLAEGGKLAAVGLILPGGVCMRILKYLLREVCKRSASGNRDLKMHYETLVCVKTETGQPVQGCLSWLKSGCKFCDVWASCFVSLIH